MTPGVFNPPRRNFNNVYKENNFLYFVFYVICYVLNIIYALIIILGQNYGATNDCERK